VVKIAYISRRYCGWFDGTDDYVEVLNSASLDLTNEFTIAIVFSAKIYMM